MPNKKNMQTPPFTISTLAINLIADISALLERYTIALEKDDGLRLRKANRIKTIHSSLAIEGNTLSEDEVAAIINGKNVVAPLRQIQEVRNAIKAYELFSTLNPFVESDLKKAHAAMMEALTDDAGHYRSSGVGVFGEKGLIHMAPGAPMVPQLMGNLFEWLRRSEDHLLIRSCVFHYEFEFIHPFSDGNGRTGRLWQSLILGQLHPSFQYLPVENMVFSNQQRYYDSIAASTKAGQSGPFIDFMLTEIRDALKMHRSSDKVPNKVPEKVPNKSEAYVLDLLSKKPRATTSELAAAIGLTDRAVRKIISGLKKQGIVKRIGSNRSGYWYVKPR